MKPDLLASLGGKPLNPDEAKKVAVALERHGFRFYNGLKDRVPSERARTVFAQMAQEERKHVSDIEALLPPGPAAWYPDPETEELVQRYFENFMEGGIFPTGADAEAAVLDLSDEIRAVELALGFEQEAVRFYQAMGRESGDAEAARSFADLARFEQGHVQMLDSLLKALQA